MYGCNQARTRCNACDYAAGYKQYGKLCIYTYHNPMATSNKGKSIEDEPVCVNNCENHKVKPQNFLRYTRSANLEKMTSINTDSEITVYVDMDQIKKDNKFLQILPADFEDDPEMKFALLDPLETTEGLVHLYSGDYQAHLSIQESSEQKTSYPEQMKFGIFVYDQNDKETRITLDLTVRPI